MNQDQFPHDDDERELLKRESEPENDEPDPALMAALRGSIAMVERKKNGVQLRIVTEDE